MAKMRNVHEFKRLYDRVFVCMKCNAKIRSDDRKVKDGKIKTVPLKEQILPGVTRDSVIKIAKDLGYELVEQDIKPEELREADELFFTGTAAEVTPIIKLDDKIFPKGPITGKLREKYLDIVHGKAGHDDWLDYV